MSTVANMVVAFKADVRDFKRGSAAVRDESRNVEAHFDKLGKAGGRIGYALMGAQNAMGIFRTSLKSLPPEFQTAANAAGAFLAVVLDIIPALREMSGLAGGLGKGAPVAAGRGGKSSWAGPVTAGAVDLAGDVGSAYMVGRMVKSAIGPTIQAESAQIAIVADQAWKPLVTTMRTELPAAIARSETALVKYAGAVSETALAARLAASSTALVRGGAGMTAEMGTVSAVTAGVPLGAAGLGVASLGLLAVGASAYGTYDYFARKQRNIENETREMYEAAMKRYQTAQMKAVQEMKVSTAALPEPNYVRDARATSEYRARQAVEQEMAAAARSRDMAFIQKQEEDRIVREERMQSKRDRAQAIREQVDPMEAFRSQMKEAQSLVLAGVMSRELFGQYGQSLIEQMAPAAMNQPNQAWNPYVSPAGLAIGSDSQTQVQKDMRRLLEQSVEQLKALVGVFGQN